MLHITQFMLAYNIIHDQRRLVTIEAHVRNLDLQSRSLTVYAV